MDRSEDWRAQDRETIVAVATPAGRGGLGIVRLSGPRAADVARAILRLEDGAVPALVPRQVRRMIFPVAVAQPNGAGREPTQGAGALDEVLVTYFPAPRSYTAEDVVEISGHGAPVLLAAIVQAAVGAGARLAAPGEFTRRAFLHGRLDLAQAEAVHDLISAETLWQARVAARQMQGSVARQLGPLREVLVEWIARLEAGIDFAEDDVPVASDPFIAAGIAELDRQTARALAGFRHGRIVREGLTVAIVGRPNVGKSSLFNALLASERAIVTAAPGTTRDTIAEAMDLDGIPLRLVDTAGLRQGESEPEVLGIERSWQAAADAELVLALFDGSQPLQPEDTALLHRLAHWPHCLPALNKWDLAPRLSAAELAAAWAGAGGDWMAGEAVPLVSARTGGGVQALRSQLRRHCLPDLDGNGDFLTNARHADCLQELQNALRRAAAALAGGLPHEAVLVDLHAGLRSLDEITGPTTTEDILGVIFARFCVGK